MASLVVATGMAQVATDKQQVEPMLEVLASLPEVLGRVEQLLADNGYFSAANVEHCVEAKIEPLLAAGRDGHHPHWEDRFTEPPPLTEAAGAMERMKHRLKTVNGRKLYGLRKQTVEPVFGIIKSALGFRQFLLRGLASVRGEWTLVTMAWNIKRMAVMAGLGEQVRARQRSSQSVKRPIPLFLRPARVPWSLSLAISTQVRQAARPCGRPCTRRSSPPISSSSRRSRSTTSTRPGPTRPSRATS
jgi:hypothetical protein